MNDCGGGVSGPAAWPGSGETGPRVYLPSGAVGGVNRSID